MTPRSALAVAILLAGGSPLPAQTVAARPAVPSPRAELDDLRTSLETAIGRPGRIRLAAGRAHAGPRLPPEGLWSRDRPRPACPARAPLRRRGGPQTRAAPAADPPGSRVVINMPEGTFDFGVIDLGDSSGRWRCRWRPRPPPCARWRPRQQEWSHAHEEEMREHLRLVEQQAEAFRLEAERARRKAERDVRTRLAPPTPIARPSRPPRRRAAAALRAAPSRPPCPTCPSSRERSLPPEPPDAPPRGASGSTSPTERARAPDGGDAEAIVTSVQERVVAGLESYRRPLASLRAEDFVTVAVDLVPDVLLRARPARTLLVRVRAGDLQDAARGASPRPTSASASSSRRTSGAGGRR
jgi:hypothetical protein